MWEGLELGTGDQTGGRTGEWVGCREAAEAEFWRLEMTWTCGMRELG